MPKRLYGICPDCGKQIGKRYGKLKIHFVAGNVGHGQVVCKGSGKKVETA